MAQVELERLSRDYTTNPPAKGERLNKEDLQYLYCELNLTSQQIADIFHCAKHSVTHACYKYGLQKSAEQRTNIAIQTNKVVQANRTLERKEEMKQKQKEWWNNRTQEEKEAWKQQVSINSQLMWENMDPQQKLNIKQKMSNSAKKRCAIQTQEQKQHRIDAFKESWHGATEQEKQQRTLNNSNSKKLWWQQLSEDKKQQRSKKRNETMCNKTIEELQQIQDKIYNTKKKNNSLNVSKPEEFCSQLLKQYFEDVQCQYKCEEFPFAVDFYIPQLNLFIDLNFHWTHGKEPFNENNTQHQKQLEQWRQRSEKSKFYSNAIYTWTDLDVRKSIITEQNGINRLVFYKQSTFENWLEEIKHGA